MDDRDEQDLDISSDDCHEFVMGLEHQIHVEESRIEAEVLVTNPHWYGDQYGGLLHLSLPGPLSDGWVVMTKAEVEHLIEGLQGLVSCMGE